MKIDHLAIVILTFNSEAVIERTLAAAARLGGRIICVDSGSSDRTLSIVAAQGADLHQRAFNHYADQRNWAIDNLADGFAWQLHLDADEVLDDAALNSIRRALDAPADYAGFMLRRRTYFLGRELRFGGADSWHLRLFKSGFGRCEDRLYDQHFLCRGATAKLAGTLHDLNVASLTEWISRHNRWSDLEATELRRETDPQAQSKLRPALSEDPRARRRLYKHLYYKAPRYWRAVGYFGYRYIGRLGFLDGRTGFLYAFLQALWFRILVDAKLDEASRLESLPSSAETTHRDARRD